jgi:hypothetical protein
MRSHDGHMRQIPSIKEDVIQAESVIKNLHIGTIYVAI